MLTTCRYTQILVYVLAGGMLLVLECVYSCAFAGKDLSCFALWMARQGACSSCVQVPKVFAWLERLEQEWSIQNLHVYMLFCIHFRLRGLACLWCTASVGRLNVIEFVRAAWPLTSLTCPSRSKALKLFKNSLERYGGGNSWRLFTAKLCHSTCMQSYLVITRILPERGGGTWRNSRKTKEVCNFPNISKQVFTLSEQIKMQAVGWSQMVLRPGSFLAMGEESYWSSSQRSQREMPNESPTKKLNKNFPFKKFSAALFWPRPALRFFKAPCPCKRLRPGLGFSSVSSLECSWCFLYCPFLGLGCPVPTSRPALRLAGSCDERTGSRPWFSRPFHPQNQVRLGLSTLIKGGMASKAWPQCSRQERPAVFPLCHFVLRLLSIFSFPIFVINKYQQTGVDVPAAVEASPS